MEKIEIGLSELLKISQASNEPTFSAGYRIVVLQRGWVAVGQVKQEGDTVTITGARIIRRWGTTQGLGELAEKGPLPDTKLDPAGILEAHPMAVVVTFATKEDLWI